MPTCEVCGRNLPEGARLCPNCGSETRRFDGSDLELRGSRQCPDCAEELGPRDRLCPFCGVRLDILPPPPSRLDNIQAPPIPRSRRALAIGAVVALIVIGQVFRINPRRTYAYTSPSRITLPSNPLDLGRVVVSPGEICALPLPSGTYGSRILASVENGSDVDMCLIPVRVWSHAHDRSGQNMELDNALARGMGVSSARVYVERVPGPESMVLVVRDSGISASSTTITVQRLP